MPEKISSRLTDENGIPLSIKRVGDKAEPMTEEQVDIIFSFIMAQRKHRCGSDIHDVNGGWGIEVRKEEHK